MTKHTIYTFSLHRKGVVMIVIGAVLVAVLLVTAGYLLGAARSRRVTESQSRRAVPVGGCSSETLRL